jgi:hypothetical protein
MIDKEAFDKDREWCETVFGEYNPDLGADLPDVHRCIYCGGEWFRQM